MSARDPQTSVEGEALMIRAQQLLQVIRAQARRAFVLELTGTPKAGKSTSVATLQTFFSQAGYQVHLLKERAADCPLPMKGHFFFNAWTTATMLAEVLETYEAMVDLLILDRGFFDALVWLELQNERGQVTDEEREVFANFVLLDRWRSLVDTTVIMRVEPEGALEREHSNQIVPRSGSMMNPDSLAQFNKALAAVEAKYATKFDLISIDTTGAKGAVDTNVRLLAELLPRIERWADPDIAVVPREALVSLFGDRPYLHEPESSNALDALQSHVRFERRSVAEKNKDLVQFIAAGIHTHDSKGVVIFERDREDKKVEAYGRSKLWVGCHVEHDHGLPLLDLAKRGLLQRIQQDLHLARPPQLDFLGLAWDASQSESQHVGMMFRAPLASDDVAKHLENKQFKKMARSRKFRSVFKTPEEILRELEDLDLEPWSKYIVEVVRLVPGTQKDSQP